MKNATSTALIAALASLDAATDRQLDCLDALADAELEAGEELADDHALVIAFNAAADEVEAQIAAVIVATGNKALELAAKAAPMERAALLDMFKPAFEGRALDLSPRVRESILAKASALAASL